MNILNFLVITFALGILCSLPGVIIGKWLSAKGIAKDRSLAVLAVNVAGVLIVHLKIFPCPWYFYVACSLLFPGIYRSDWPSYLAQGKFWWLKEPQRKMTLTEFILVALGGLLMLIIVISFLIG
jgi:hypothetical protein